MVTVGPLAQDFEKEIHLGWRPHQHAVRRSGAQHVGFGQEGEEPHPWVHIVGTSPANSFCQGEVQPGGLTSLPPGAPLKKSGGIITGAARTVKSALSRLFGAQMGPMRNGRFELVPSVCWERKSRDSASPNFMTGGPGRTAFSK